MTAGKTSSKLKLSERREKACELYGRGYTVTDVGREIGVSRATAHAYKKEWKARIAAQVKEDPAAFRDVLGNTLEALAETDDLRRMAWKQLERKDEEVEVWCEDCQASITYVIQSPPTDQARVQYSNLLLKATEQRAKLFGLLGVKQEVFIEIQNVNIVQNKILEWMARNLDPATSASLATFIETDLQQYVSGGSTSEPAGVIDASVLGELAPKPSALDESAPDTRLSPSVL